MTWFPPHIERRRGSLDSTSLHRALLSSLAMMVFAAPFVGCASIPAFPSTLPSRTVEEVASVPPKYSAEELSRLAAMPVIPVFDAPDEAPAVAVAGSGVLAERGSFELGSSDHGLSELSRSQQDSTTTTPAIPDRLLADRSLAGVSTADVSASAGSMDVPPPVDPAPSTEAVADVAIADVASTDLQSGQTERVQSPGVPSPKSEDFGAENASPIARTEPAPAASTTSKVAQAESKSTTRDTNSSAQRLAATKPANAVRPTGVLVSPPASFAWQQTGKSTGNRPFETVKLGDEGYRTLVLGSVGGNDPLALELIEQLARRLHDDSIILGGFDCTIIRTMNPDGEANRTFRNQSGEYVNHGFPKSLAEAPNMKMAEARFVLENLDILRPQRVVHIRSVEGAAGVIATGFSSQPAAREAAEWLKFKMVMLPDASKPGSLERYVSTSGLADMITIGIPDTTPKEDVWDLYGDTLMNLMLSDDMATREVARKP